MPIIMFPIIPAKVLATKDKRTEVKPIAIILA